MTADATYTFTMDAVGTVIHPNIYEVLANTLTAAGVRAFVGQAEGRPQVPYCVLSADWEPEPDIGQELLAIPSGQRISVEIHCYGRNNMDALWLDATVYTVLMAPDAQFVGATVIWRDADDSPVLTRTSTSALIISKHWYRIAYLREGT